jgi:hypothetical protein
MGRKRHLCWRDGHILVAGDGYHCLSCDCMVKTDDKVSITVTNWQQPAINPAANTDTA